MTEPHHTRCWLSDREDGLPVGWHWPKTDPETSVRFRSAPLAEPLAERTTPNGISAGGLERLHALDRAGGSRGRR